MGKLNLRFYQKKHFSFRVDSIHIIHHVGEDEDDNQSGWKKVLTDEKEQIIFFKEFAKKMTLNP